MSRIRANTIVNGAGTGAPNFPRGAIISGISTITAEISVGAGTSISSPATNELALGTNNVERLRIDSAGNIGIGTDNPAKSLSILSSQSVMLQLESTSTTARIGFKVPNTSNSPTIGVSDEEDLQFRTGGSERLRITSGGDVQIANGNLVVASGHGIDFSATADGSGTSTSELLDDYEEGTFTPSVTFGGNSVGVTYTALRNGVYTRIGRLVHCYVAIQLTSKGSSTGNVFIEGLPFTATDIIAYTSIEGGGSAIYQGDVNGTIVGHFAAAVINSQSYFEVYDLSTTSAGTSANIDNSDIQDTFSVRFVLTYTAT